MAAKKKPRSKKANQLQHQTNQTHGEGQSIGSAVHPTTVLSANGEDLINVSPSRVRFQHSRIRPFFSGCGRSVTGTLDEIRRGSLEPGDLPPIQVLVGPDVNDGIGPWYFSLNNRRLWVLKQCHKEGLLDNERYNNTIPVRVRIPKSAAEAERYCVDNCALEAKFMREGGNGGGKSKRNKGGGRKGSAPCVKDGDSDLRGKSGIMADTHNKFNDDVTNREEKDDGSKTAGNDGVSKSDNASLDESESDGDIASDNPFSALF